MLVLHNGVILWCDVMCMIRCDDVLCLYRAMERCRDATLSYVVILCSDTLFKYDVVAQATRNSHLVGPITLDIKVRH